MQTSAATWLFATALLLSIALRFWLAGRQIRHVAAHRSQVPAAFSASVSAESHRRAADYTLAKARLGLVTGAFGAALLIVWTLLGGLDLLAAGLREALLPRLPGASGEMAYQLALLGSFVAIGSLLELPFDLYATFGIEQRFGFNRMTWRLYATDALKSALVGLAIGLPLAALVLWLMKIAGPTWWLWAWCAWIGLNLLLLVLYPTLIAPWFNRFDPLDDSTLRSRVDALMARCGFSVKGFYVMNGSRRSAHANAYFTGLGRAKRVVFFDTLLAKLTPAEVEAVLAHELGHFSHRHVVKRIGLMALLSLAGFALLGYLSHHSGFYTALGVEPSLAAPNDALALLLFVLVAPTFGFYLSPLFAALSRRQEFEADAYACAHADGRSLAGALLKLHEDNASTLTPDPLYSRFYYSHPAPVERLAALRPDALRPA